MYYGFEFGWVGFSLWERLACAKWKGWDGSFFSFSSIHSDGHQNELVLAYPLPADYQGGLGVRISRVVWDDRLREEWKITFDSWFAGISSRGFTS